MTLVSDDGIRGLRSGNRRILARTITLIESSHPEHRAAATALLEQLLPYTGKAVRVGISGVPGVGKSCFIERLGRLLLEKGLRVAVLAVDPSSRQSGGSVLADKTRMEGLAADERAFIRPSPSGGTLGGVAGKTRETMLVCEAAGFEVVLVETVGTGQSETAVASMVDFFLVLMLSGAGDELQGIKKGVLELADALAINKADGDNVEKAQLAQKEYETAFRLLRPASQAWSPPVMLCSAREGTGVEAIWTTILRHRECTKASGEFEQKRRRQSLDWMWSLLEEGLKDRLNHHPGVQNMLPALAGQVEEGRLSPAAASRALLAAFDGRPGPAVDCGCDQGSAGECG